MKTGIYIIYLAFLVQYHVSFGKGQKTLNSIVPYQFKLEKVVRGTSYLLAIISSSFPDQPQMIRIPG